MKSKFVKALCLAAGFAAGTAMAPLPAFAESGGDLVITQDLEISSLDPLYGSAIGHDRTILNLFYENLFNIDPAGEMVPRLATNWEVAADGMSLTADLQHDVVFSDGTPFDAGAVKANIDRLTSERETSKMAQLADAISGAEVIDVDTIKINFSRPSGSAISILASEAGMIVSPNALDDKEALRRNPVGTGPFLLQDWRGGFQLNVTRNGEYWRIDESGEHLPYLDSVTVRFITDTATAINEALAGTAHIIDRIQTKDFARVEAAPELELYDNPSQITQFLIFNNSGEPFGDNLKLRQAVVAAINPAQIEKVISGGLGRVNPTWVPHTSWEYDADLETPEQDIEKARKLYAESGHQGPITMSIIQRDPDTQISQLVQAQLAQAGIPLEIEVLEREAWLDKTRNRKHQMAMLRSTAPMTDPDVRWSGYYMPDSGNNYSAIHDEEFIEGVRAAEQETDFAKRKQMYSDLQKHLLENAYEVYLFARPAAEVLRKEVAGFQTELVGGWDLSEVRLID